MSSLVSVIIPCYNAEDWLGEAIDSCLTQSRCPLEVIVVDDGSSDESLDVARRYAERHEEVEAVTQPNRGAPAARNRGFWMSRGRYIQFLDADDRLAPDKFGRQVAVLNEGKVDVVTGSWQPLVEQEDGSFELEPVQTPYLSDDPLASLVRYDGWAPPAAQLMAREIVERVDGWDESLSCMQDVDFLVRIALAGGRFERVDTVCAYRRRPNRPTVSTRDNETFNQNCLRIYERLFTYYERKSSWTEERKQTAIRNYGWLARYYYDRDRDIFNKCVDRLETITEGYVPPADIHNVNWAVRLLSRIIGYRRAEQVASWYRRARSIIAP
jgi:glycosyltransferase involved in cell wall biosynthesis